MYETDTSETCMKFIDKYITTERNELSLKFQHHRHTHCCRRLVNDVQVCRFGIPYPPMTKTRIFTPLPEDFPAGKRVNSKHNLSKVKQQLELYQKDGFPEISYSEFLSSVNINEEEYFEAIRSNIRRPTVFLKRDIDATFMNAYNLKLLTAWRSNVDIQFVLDPYACAKYLASYMSKAYRGMSTLLRKTASELERGNMAVKAKLKALGSTFVNKSEVSAQEAAYGILGLKLSKFSRDHVFINTGPIEERISLTKPRKALEVLDENDTDIIVRGLLDHYSQRSSELETTCLADYAAWYNYKSGDAPMKSRQPTYNQADFIGHVQKRLFAKVIRYRRYGEKRDPINFYREQVLLFHPWRNEELEVNSAPERTYDENKNSIILKFMDYDSFARSGLCMDELLKEKKNAQTDEYSSSEEDSENAGVGPTDQTLFESDSAIVIRDRFPLTGIIEESEYHKLITCLNEKQRNYVLHVLNSIKADSQLLEYLSGGAGVGKSTAVKAIVQVLARYYTSRFGARLDEICVLLCAPTGIAAFNIGGATLHSTFILPYNQERGRDNGELRPLSENIRTEIASKLLGVKLVICDELSMVSNKHLAFINHRLQEIFRSTNVFGGKSVIFVGDLWQLPPIASGYISPLKKDISSLAGIALWENFRFYELDEIMRQSDDPAFAIALSHMNTGVMTPDDIRLLKSREISPSNVPPKGAVWLFYERKDVKLHNDTALKNATDTGILSTANDVIEGKCKLEGKSSEILLAAAKNVDFQKANGLPYEILLKKSIRYMVTSNINTSDGITNGAIGILRHVTCRHVKTEAGTKSFPTTVWLEFPDQRTGAKARERYTGSKPPEVLETWTPIGLETKTAKDCPGEHRRVVRTQFPLTPAEAITIHKSQSLTILQMVLTPHIGISRSLLYTGCSRAKTSDGLWINGTFVPPKCVLPTDPVLKAYESLRSRPVILSHLHTPATKNGMNSLVFYNVEHLNPHMSDVLALIKSFKPNLLAMVETHTFRNQKIEIPGYKILHRSDSRKKSSHGTVCFSSN